MRRTRPAARARRAGRGRSRPPRPPRRAARARARPRRSAGRTTCRRRAPARAAARGPGVAARARRTRIAATASAMPTAIAASSSSSTVASVCVRVDERDVARVVAVPARQRVEQRPRPPGARARPRTPRRRARGSAREQSRPFGNASSACTSTREDEVRREHADRVRQRRRSRRAARRAATRSPTAASSRPKRAVRPPPQRDEAGADERQADDDRQRGVAGRIRRVPARRGHVDGGARSRRAPRGERERQHGLAAGPRAVPRAAPAPSPARRRSRSLTRAASRAPPPESSPFVTNPRAPLARSAARTRERSRLDTSTIAQRRVAREQPRGDLEAVDVRELDVEQDELGLELGGQGDAPWRRPPPRRRRRSPRP